VTTPTWSSSVFAERGHAELFSARFGGEFIDPEARPKWPGARR
jgi:hypothetical protein